MQYECFYNAHNHARRLRLGLKNYSMYSFFEVPQRAVLVLQQ
jgi:hypothetical protein